MAANSQREFHKCEFLVKAYKWMCQETEDKVTDPSEVSSHPVL